MKEDLKEDILTNIKPVSHYESYPKAMIGSRILLAGFTFGDEL